ncbi:hypothetical protein [Hyphococcus sp.]|uniref:hypothetical protein n=1 Tax=Hyphococcus sp. TaxID=2038636 RepID=UPI003CCBFC17
MPSASLQERNVRELQELALEAPIQRQKRRSPQISRGARLHLIDVLSRWSAPGLAMIAGGSIYLAIVAGRDYPARALAWGAILLCSLWVCRRMRSEFRSGGRLSAHPFRWRASYTSASCVLGVAFSCAPVLLVPAGAAAGLAIQIIALMLLISFVAALFHAAHFFAAAAIAAPAVAFTILAGARAQETGIVAGAVATAVLGIAGLIFVNRYLEKSASRQYPRTGFLRRELDRTDSDRYDAHSDETRALQA